MSKESEGIFVIQYKDYNGHKPYVTDSILPTLDENDALLFETKTKAYKFMLENKLDKECIIQKID